VRTELDVGCEMWAASTRATGRWLVNEWARRGEEGADDARGAKRKLQRLEEMELGRDDAEGDGARAGGHGWQEPITDWGASDGE
jgi:hypothetical protein